MSMALIFMRSSLLARCGGGNEVGASFLAAWSRQRKGRGSRRRTHPRGRWDRRARRIMMRAHGEANEHTRYGGGGAGAAAARILRRRGARSDRHADRASRRRRRREPVLRQSLRDVSPASGGDGGESAV